MGFENNLAFGKVAEGQIATWLRKEKGWSVLPIYEIEKNQFKGPQLFTPQGGLIAPDLLALKGTKVKWVEAKHKTVFTWHRLTQRWTTGIDLRHYKDYLNVAEHLPYPLWLMFLHSSSRPDPRDLAADPKCPRVCPTGLFGNTISVLKACVNHTSDRHGKTGMVYWAKEKLVKFDYEVQQ